MSLQTFREVGASGPDLLTVGFEYLRNAGRRTQLIESIEADMAFAAKGIMGLQIGVATPPPDNTLGVAVTGRWRHGMIQDTLVLIISEAGQMRIERVTDNGKLVDPIMEVPSAVGRRFNIVDDPREWFVITGQGTLEIWDTLGLYTIARKID